MNTRTRWLCLPLIVTVLAFGAATVTAQDEAPSPDELWSFQPDNEASVNDVSIAADGSVAAAALAEGPNLGPSEGEVCPWDLANAPESGDTAWTSCGSADAGLLSSQTMDHIAVQPRGGEDAWVAASGENRVHVWSLTAGSGSNNAAEYQDGSPPSEDVQDLVFLEERWILAYHAETLVLLEHESGTTFVEGEDARWEAADGATIVDIAIAGNNERMFVSTTNMDVANSDVQVYALTIENGGFEEQGELTLSNRGDEGLLATDEEGSFLVVGTDDGWMFYYHVFEDTVDGEQVLAFSPSPYTAEVDAVTAISVGTFGIHIAVGTAQGEVTFFEQTFVETDQDGNHEGPRAAPAHTVDVDGEPSQILFVDQGHQVYVVADDLHAFHAHQFDQDDIEPLWTQEGLSLATFTQDGQRFLATDGSTVFAYEQAYTATLGVEGASAVRPGQPSTFTVTVNNTGSLFDTYELSTHDLPPAWTSTFDRTHIELLPGQTGTAELNLTPAEHQSPGDVTVTVRATSQASPNEAIAGETTATLTVQEVRAAQIETPSDRIEAQQGETVTIPADVTNAGNTDATIELFIDQEGAWDVAIEEASGERAEVDLEPGEERRLNVTLDVPEDAPEGTINPVTLTASPAEGGTEDEATVTIVVDPSYAATITGPDDPILVEPDTEETFRVTVENTGNVDDTYRLIAHSNATNPEHLWEATIAQPNVEVDADESVDVDITVNVPRGAERTEGTDVTIVVRSTFTGDKLDEGTYTLEVPEEDENGLPLGLIVPALALSTAALLHRRRP